MLKNAVILGWFRDTQIFLLSCCFFPFDLVVLLFLSSTALGTVVERKCFLVAKAGVIVLVKGFFPVVLSFGGRSASVRAEFRAPGGFGEVVAVEATVLVVRHNHR